MNFLDTLSSVELVLATDEVPLIVGESGIGKTALAKALAAKNNWSYVVIDGNLLKEGEIGGLPTVKEHTTVYAVHHKLRTIADEVAKGKTVLLFIDELNRCEHAVQQELMNLILNREINGYQVPEAVKIMAAMNPSNQEDEEMAYQVVEMDRAQENRFVWLEMESDFLQWIGWAMEAGIEPDVMAFLSTFPSYLYQKNPGDISATPRSYERISKSYAYYKAHQEQVSRQVFLNVVRGNVGKVIATSFMQFVEAGSHVLVSYEELVELPEVSQEVREKLASETHTRLYLTAKNVLARLEQELAHQQEGAVTKLHRWIGCLSYFPIDLRIGVMREMKANYPCCYRLAIEEEAFVEAYFSSYRNQ